MSYTDYFEERFVHFSGEESNKIESWLKEHGYTYLTNTVCGSCCGMYEDEYWVNGIGGKWKPGDDYKFKAYCKTEKISAEVDGYTIRAVE